MEGGNRWSAFSGQQSALSYQWSVIGSFGGQQSLIKIKSRNLTTDRRLPIADRRLLTAKSRPLIADCPKDISQKSGLIY
ncbi:MAG: hypothetical protein MUF58_05235 [Arcicella sp.]|nr:hypothetical protein [Arcicella sp.]